MMLLDLLLCFFMLIAAFLVAGFPLLGTIGLVLSSFVETSNLEFFSTEIPLYGIFVGVFLVGSLIRFSLMEERTYGTFFYACLLIIISGFLSAFFSINPYNAFAEACRTALFIATAFFISEFIETRSHHHWVLYAFMCTLLFSSIYVIFQGFEASNLGGFKSENFCPVAIAMFLPLLFIKNKPNSYFPWLIPLVYTFLLVIGLITGTRSGIFLLLFVLAGSILLHSQHRRWLKPLGWLVLAGVAMKIIFLLGELLGGNGNPPEIFTLLQERMKNMWFSLEAFFHHPIFGVGAGQYAAYAEWSFPSFSNEVSPQFSSLFVFLAERGLFGILPAAWLIVLFFQHSKQIGLRYHHPSIYPAFILSLSCITLASIIHSIHQHFFFWCLLGFLYPLPEVSNTNNHLPKDKS